MNAREIVSRLLDSAGSIRTLRDFRALPDNRLYLCHDSSVAHRHALPLPFECGSRQWMGGGVVRIEFYSRNPDYGSQWQCSDYANVRLLEAVPGKTWSFDETPGF